MNNKISQWIVMNSSLKWLALCLMQRKHLLKNPVSSLVLLPCDYVADSHYSPYMNSMKSPRPPQILNEWILIIDPWEITELSSCRHLVTFFFFFGSTKTLFLLYNFVFQHPCKTSQFDQCWKHSLYTFSCVT